MKLSQILLYQIVAFVSSAQTTEPRIRGWFHDEVERQRMSYLRFTGRHSRLESNSSMLREMVDFDFTAEISGFIELRSIEMTTSNDADRVIILSAGDNVAEEKEMIQQAIEKLECIAAPDYNRIVFNNVFVNRDGMASALQVWANCAKYGGRLDFEHDTTSSFLMPETRTIPTSDHPQINIQAVWRYKWTKPKIESRTRYALPTQPNILVGPRPMTWGLRVQHAMVDGEKGVITLGDDVSQGTPMIKAIGKYALRESLTRQGNFGTSKSHKWGLDEPNDEPLYVGFRHFGGAAQVDTPPSYTD